MKCWSLSQTEFINSLPWMGGGGGGVAHRTLLLLTNYGLLLDSLGRQSLSAAEYP